MQWKRRDEPMADVPTPAVPDGCTGRRPRKFIPRAPRFAVVLSLRYRPARNIVWQRGTTVNISRTGVLFSTDQLLAPDTPVELLLTMPAECSGEAAGRILCSGRIARVVRPDDPSVQPALAATIGSYRLERPDDGAARLAGGDVRPES